ncbi:MAG: DUF6265 family protein [Pseudomonadales bacterium]
MRVALILWMLISANPVAAESGPLDFMLGRWQATDFGQGAEEFWSGDASSLAGVFRGVLNDGRVITEFMLIEHDEGKYVLRWNHFNEDFSRWEAEPIEHELVGVETNYANFAMSKAVKGLPKNLVYRRTGDILTVWVGDLEATDTPGAFQLNYQRVGP